MPELYDDEIPVTAAFAPEDDAPPINGNIPNDTSTPQTREQLLATLGALSTPERRNLIGLLSLDVDEPFVYQTSFFQGSSRSDLPRYIGIVYLDSMTFQEVRVTLRGDVVQGGEVLRLLVVYNDLDAGWTVGTASELTLAAGQSVASFAIDQSLSGQVLLLGSDNTDTYLFVGSDTYPNAPALPGYYGYSGTFAEFPGEGPQFYGEAYTPVIQLFHTGSPADVAGPLEHTFYTAEGVAYALENANPVQLERIRAVLGVAAPPSGGGVE